MVFLLLIIGRAWKRNEYVVSLIGKVSMVIWHWVYVLFFFNFLRFFDLLFLFLVSKSYFVSVVIGKFVKVTYRSREGGSCTLVFYSSMLLELSLSFVTGFLG